MPDKLTITLKQYMNKEFTHREYNEQYVTERMMNIVENRFGAEKLATRLDEDEHLNNIPLIVWDRIGEIINCDELNKAMRANGDWTTLAGLVCVAKAAARMVVDRHLSHEVL